MSWKMLSGERFTKKLVGVFDYENEAIVIMERLKQQLGLRDEQMQLVHPYEKNYDIKLEPETRGVARTAVRAHTTSGVGGLLVGILIWAVLYAVGGDAVRSAPIGAAVAIIFFATAAGLMLGGLITARPDHEGVILHVREAVEQGKWALIVHSRGASQSNKAEAILSNRTDDVLSSV